MFLPLSSVWPSHRTEKSSLILSASFVSCHGTKRLTLGADSRCTVQAAGILFEATRLVMVQRLLSSAEFKMDPMVSLYYFAPACAVINGVFTLFVEIPKMSMTDIYNLGITVLILNAFVAFLLNVSVVLLVSSHLHFQTHTLTKTL